MSPTPNLPVATPAVSLATDHPALCDAVAGLFKASDVKSVAAAVAAYVCTLAPSGTVQWHDAQAPADEHADTCVVNLLRDPESPRWLRAHLPSAADTPEARAELDWLGKQAGVRLRQLGETAHLYDAVSRLAQAERLQRALYDIADQATTDRDMDEVMRSLHGIVGSLMYAENFYIALYDAGADNLHFAYFVDSTDPVADLPKDRLSMESVRHTLTWHLIRMGRPIMGSMEQLEEQIDGPLEVNGPPCVDWLGVPLLNGGDVTGALVVQSYREDSHYTEQDRELLAYVAQHVQAALERRHAHAELERRVAERTEALREANQVLQQQVLERQRGEKLQAALFRIAELANTAGSIDDFYAALHKVIAGLLYARNFYIALLHEDQTHLTFPYSVDEVDSHRETRILGQGLTEYVLRHGRPQLVNHEDLENMRAQGELLGSGSDADCWLGVPLICDERVEGVLAVQSYTHEQRYSQRDQELLTFVSYHVANALQRKRRADSLKLGKAHLERRVTERTRALALANRDLREQIAERERVERRLKYETLHDALTGLPNRALLLQRLDQVLQRYHAQPDHLFAVLFIDLDRFKVINDSVGHLIGDDLLFQVGGRIRGCLKTRDLVARLGGDEFAVVIEEIENTDVVQNIAERIIEELHAPFRIGSKELFTSASIGITFASSHYHRAEELLRDADSAMYSAKEGGRHRAKLFDDRLRRNAISQLEIEGDLRRALTRDEFEPHYQPVVRLSDGRICGYEALMRWRHPDRGLLLPGEFLSIAEDSGCDESIDWKIFAKVFADMPALTGTHGFVSINLSGHHFRSPDIDERLLELLNQHRVSPHKLRVEVTEGTLLENPEQVKRSLNGLRRHGITIALDDFGTGYSSLSYMHQYPIEVLKIDRSFVIRIDGQGGHQPDQQGEAIVRAIQAMADSLNMQVIAEGIETEEQRHALRRIGCRFGQGFLFHRAQPVSHWLERTVEQS